ncbi:MAG: LysR family transcriptional regulator [Gammaproteobacteria bacterium]|nr:LysR family transcriptional regulator [Gammaproteobacteria bacterium]
MDRLEAMLSFVKVVEAGSVSGAADRLGVAKSAVSRRLRDLEAHLGAELVRRTTRRLALTDSGRAYYERCRRILEDVNEAEEAVSIQQGRLAGRLRVAAPLSFGLQHLQPAIIEFMRRHPDVEFDLDLNDRQVDLMAEGLDVGVRIADLADSSLMARRLAPVRSLVCASPDYLAAHGTPDTPEALAGHDCLVYTNQPDPFLWRYQDATGKSGHVGIHPRLAANNGDLLCEAAAAGQGILLTPTFIAYRDIVAGRLHPILTGLRWPQINAYALYPQTRHLSARVRAFVDFLAERFAGEPYWDTEIGQAGDGHEA